MPDGPEVPLAMFYFKLGRQQECHFPFNGTIFFSFCGFQDGGVHGDGVVGQIPLLPASSSAHRAPLPPFQIEVGVKELLASCQPGVERAEPTTSRCFVHLAKNKTGSPPHLRLSRALEKNSQ